jgi:undecaprenyl-diphosphatase
MTDPGVMVAVFLGLVQGITEFLPISSSGHLAALQVLFPFMAYPGVTLELATHLGTAVAVVLYHRRLVLGIVGLLPADDPGLLGHTRLAWWKFGIIGSLPIAIVGLGAQDIVRAAFGDLLWIGIGLAFTGAVLMTSRLKPQPDGDLTARRAAVIGLAQAVAVFPGVSRSGMTITTAMLTNVRSKQAVTFSLLLSIPAILGALLLDGAQRFAQHRLATLLSIDLAFATLAAGLIGYYCIGLVHRVTRTGLWHRFAWYCWLAAILLIQVAH